MDILYTIQNVYIYIYMHRHTLKSNSRENETKRKNVNTQSAIESQSKLFTMSHNLNLTFTHWRSVAAAAVHSYVCRLLFVVVAAVSLLFYTSNGVVFVIVVVFVCFFDFTVSLCGSHVAGIRMRWIENVCIYCFSFQNNKLKMFGYT